MILKHSSEYDDNVSNLVKSGDCKLSRIYFRMTATYINSDTIIIPSKYESFGLVAIEAMAAESCIICIRYVRFSRGTENNNDGILIKNDPNSSKTFSECILKLLDNKDQIEMFKNARTYSKVRYKNNVKKFLNFIIKLLILKRHFLNFILNKRNNNRNQNNELIRSDIKRNIFLNSKDFFIFFISYF